jgi:hypothetical protein
MQAATLVATWRADDPHDRRNWLFDEPQRRGRSLATVYKLPEQSETIMGTNKDECRSTPANHDGVKLRGEDVLVNLIEVPKENWSFGNGEAQYVSSSH